MYEPTDQTSLKRKDGIYRIQFWFNRSPLRVIFTLRRTYEQNYSNAHKYTAIITTERTTL